MFQCRYGPAAGLVATGRAGPRRTWHVAGGGAIGGVAGRHFSFQGSVPAPGRLVKQTAPEVAARLREDGVDAVLLTPV